jgi:hypothetical protein
MNSLFDDICRILATPMPRRRAFKMISVGLAGAIMTPLAFGQKTAPVLNNCKTINCTGGQTCCCLNTTTNSNGTCPSASISGASKTWCCPSGTSCAPAGTYCTNSGKKQVSPTKIS